MSLYDFQGFKVEKPESMPSVRHWAILLFETKVYNDSGWSEREGGGSTPHVHPSYYAFTDRAEWQRMVDFLTTDRPIGSVPHSFVCFEASGKAKLRIDVKVSIESGL